MKKTIALLLAVLMLVALLPAAAFAEDAAPEAQALDANGEVIETNGTFAGCLSAANVAKIVLLANVASEDAIVFPAAVELDLGGFKLVAPEFQVDASLAIVGDGFMDGKFIGEGTVKIFAGTFTDPATVGFGVDPFKVLPSSDGKTFVAVNPLVAEYITDVVKATYETVDKTDARNAAFAEVCAQAQGIIDEALAAKDATVESYRFAVAEAQAIVFATVVGFAKEDAIALVYEAAYEGVDINNGEEPSKAVMALVKEAERNIKLASYELFTPAAFAKEYVEAIHNMQFAERQAKEAFEFAKEFATDLMGKDGPIQKEQENTKSFIAKIVDIIVNLFKAIFAPLFAASGANDA